MTLAPIVLFVYNRPWHSQQTIEALQKNELSSESELFIYSDAPKAEKDQEKVQEVRDYVHSIGGFKKLTIIERVENWGLANSIVDGVTAIVNQYGKVIVLEDDLVTSPYFLKFMNNALNYYQNQQKVMHISGWNYPINNNGFDDVFLWRLMNCWGWATWKDRWINYEKDVKKTISEFSKQDIEKLNLDGIDDIWAQVIANKEKKISTWAIFWYVSIFKKNGLCLNPTQTFVENIGNDGSGMHCGESDAYKSNLSELNTIQFINKLEENEFIVKEIKSFFLSQRKSIFDRIIIKLKKVC